MSAVPSSPPLCVVDDSDPLVGELADVPPSPAGLLEMLAQVPDPRQPRGVRHCLDGGLAVALAASANWAGPGAAGGCPSMPARKRARKPTEQCRGYG